MCQKSQAILFKLHRVIVIEIINAYNLMSIRQQAFGQMITNESRRAGD